MADFPAWQAFQEGGHPAPIGGSEEGRIVAIVASAGAMRAGWASDLALRMGSGWGADGRRVIIADGGLDQPTLHKAAELENEEGLTDAALFGASVARVARPFQERSCFLITAGSPTADVGAVADSPRWKRLLGGFVEAGVTLVLFLRAEGEACNAFLPAATDVVLFCERGEDLPLVIEGALERVRAVTGSAEARNGDHLADADGRPAGAGVQGAGATVGGSGGGAESAPSDEAPFRPGRSRTGAGSERRRASERSQPPRPGLRPVPSSGGARKALFFVVALMAVAFIAVFLLTSLGAVDAGHDPAVAAESR